MPAAKKHRCAMCNQPSADNARLTLQCGCSITAHVEPAAMRRFEAGTREELHIPCAEHGDTKMFACAPLVSA